MKNLINKWNYRLQRASPFKIIVITSAIWYLLMIFTNFALMIFVLS
jgi:hypothetical protein